MAYSLCDQLTDSFFARCCGCWLWFWKYLELYFQVMDQQVSDFGRVESGHWSDRCTCA